MKIYLSGPVSGMPQYNSKAFKEACEFVLKECELLPLVEVINPLDIADTIFARFKELEIGTEPIWEDFMKADIKALMDASCVYFLPGWEKSKGATIEHFLTNTLGIPHVTTKAQFRKFIKNI